MTGRDTSTAWMSRQPGTRRHAGGDVRRRTGTAMNANEHDVCAAVIDKLRAEVERLRQERDRERGISIEQARLTNALRARITQLQQEHSALLAAFIERGHERDAALERVRFLEGTENADVDLAESENDRLRARVTQLETLVAQMEHVAQGHGWTFDLSGGDVSDELLVGFALTESIRDDEIPDTEFASPGMTRDEDFPGQIADGIWVPVFCRKSDLTAARERDARGRPEQEPPPTYSPFNYAANRDRADVPEREQP